MINCHFVVRFDILSVLFRQNVSKKEILCFGKLFVNLPHRKNFIINNYELR
jgi:hypothetical protein